MINQNGKFVHESTIPVRWYDMDAYGHVNTSVYFTYFEQTRINWFFEIANTFQIGKTGPVVVNASCTYYRSIIYPETILSKLFVGPPGRSSFDSFCQMYSQKNPELLYAEAYAKIVWTDRETQRSTPIPEELKKFLPEA